MSTLLSSLLATLGKNKTKVKVPTQNPPKKSVSAKKTVAKTHPAPSAVSTEITAQAQAAAREIIGFAREEADKIRLSAREEIRVLELSLKDGAAKLKEQEQEQLRRQQGITARESVLESKSQEIEALKIDITEIQKKQIAKLEKIASLTRDKAKEILLEAVDKKISRDIADRLREAEDQIKEGIEDKAQELLIDAMYHGATDYVAEYTISTVKIPDDEVKGRVIGKDGRNIRTFEKVTGVDIDMDETPGEIRLSCYNPVRREIARVALERLIKDGRIQPTRIEEYVTKAKHDIEKVMFEEGKKLCHAVGAFNVQSDLIAMLGRFKYRSSYGQNLIAHTIEETKIGTKLAHELGVNVNTVKLGCLLHDIGKVAEDPDDNHVALGVRIAKKFNMPQPVIDCIAQHHEDESFSG